MKKDYCIGVCEKSGITFKFDAEDKERVEAHRWWSQKSGVFAHVDGTTVSLSKFLLGIVEKNTKVLKRNGDIYDYRKANLFYHNQFVLCGDYYEVECFDGKKFLVDADRLDDISQFVWHIDKNNYAITKDRSGRILKLHRYLLGVLDRSDIEVDHINRNTLDNRMSNLRLADRSLNCYNRDVSAYNSSGKVGVYKMTGYNKWCAQINVHGSRYYLGSFDTFDEAVTARTNAENHYYN